MGADSRHPSFLRDSNEKHDSSDHIEEELKHALLRYGEFAKVVGERATRGVCFTQRHFTLLVWSAKSIYSKQGSKSKQRRTPNWTISYWKGWSLTVLGPMGIFKLAA